MDVYEKLSNISKQHVYAEVQPVVRYTIMLTFDFTLNKPFKVEQYCLKKSSVFNFKSNNPFKAEPYCLKKSSVFNFTLNNPFKAKHYCLKKIFCISFYIEQSL